MSIPAYGYYYLPVPGPGGLREALASESLSGERGTQAALLRNLSTIWEVTGAAEAGDVRRCAGLNDFPHVGSAAGNSITLN